MNKIRAVVAALAMVGLLSACGDPTKAEILKKAEGADTKAALEKVLGQPDDVKKLGPLESWGYSASDGAVSFMIAGEQVTMSVTSDEKLTKQAP